MRWLRGFLDKYCIAFLYELLVIGPTVCQPTRHSLLEAFVLHFLPSWKRSGENCKVSEWVRLEFCFAFSYLVTEPPRPDKGRQVGPGPSFGLAYAKANTCIIIVPFWRD